MPGITTKRVLSGPTKFCSSVPEIQFKISSARGHTLDISYSWVGFKFVLLPH